MGKWSIFDYNAVILGKVTDYMTSFCPAEVRLRVCACPAQVRVRVCACLVWPGWHSDPGHGSAAAPSGSRLDPGSLKYIQKI